MTFVCRRWNGKSPPVIWTQRGPGWFACMRPREAYISGEAGHWQRVYLLLYGARTQA